MRVSRVYVSAPLVSGAAAVLEGTAANHIARVLRLRPADPLLLFDGRGGEYRAKLTEVKGARVIVAVGAHEAIERESQLNLTLLQGIARADRMDTIVQKATELGVSRIVPLMSERSVVRLSGASGHRKHAHWLGIAIAACEQCGRNRLPELAQPQSLGDALADVEAAAARGLLLLPGAAQSLAGAADGAPRLALLIGPEGGLAPTEVEFALARHFSACRIGPRILRTESASLAALAALQALQGDFA